jgi:hypothetical protein
VMPESEVFRSDSELEPAGFITISEILYCRWTPESKQGSCLSP